MTDKEKFRKEVEKLKSNLIYGACSSQIAMETRCKEEAYNEVLAILDTMQEEPKYRFNVGDKVQSVSGKIAKIESVGTDKYWCIGERGMSIPFKYQDQWELVEEPKQCMYSKDNYTEEDRKVLCEGCEEKCEFNQVKVSAILQHKEETCKENGDSLTQEPVSEDLGEYINELSKQFPEVSFAKLSRIAVRVAKWQKEQFEKERLKHCDGLTDEQAQIESDFITQHLKDNNRTPTFIDAIEYGMKMQKEKMVAKAIDGIARPDDDEVWCDLKSFNFKDGDKVKVIVIKED